MSFNNNNSNNNNFNTFSSKSQDKSESVEYDQLMSFIINCVEENNRVEANKSFDPVYYSFSTRNQPLTASEAIYVKRFCQLLNEEHRVLMKTILPTDVSVDTSIDTKTYQTEYTEQSYRSEVNDISLDSEVNFSSNRSIAELHKRTEDDSISFFEDVQPEIKPKYAFSYFWLLDTIRRQHYMKNIYELPKKIFDIVCSIPLEEVFEKEFIMEKCEFVQKKEYLENYTIPLFVNTPKLLTPSTEFKIEIERSPLIFRHYFKDDIKLGNIILVARPTESQMHSGCKIFGYKFSFIGMMGKGEPFGVFVNFEESKNARTFLSDFPGVEDNVSTINSIHYYSVFQNGIAITVSEPSHYPDVMKFSQVPNQLCYSGTISFDIASFYWSKISRDKKGVYSVPSVIRMLYRGYLGDFLVVKSMESTVYVNDEMNTTIGDLGYVMLFDQSNAIPYGMISHNVVAILLHYGVSPETLFAKVTKFIEEREIVSVLTKIQTHYMYSIIDRNDPFSEALKLHINISQLLLQRHIPLKPTYRLVGVLDPFGSLQKGEIVLGLESSILATLGQTALVANNNAVHPLSLQRFKIANDKFALKNYTGCIIFSAQDSFFYFNTHFDSINFTYRKSDFIIIGEREQKQNSDPLMELDSDDLLESMKVNLTFTNIVGRIINQTDSERERIVNLHLLDAIMNNEEELFKDYARTLIKLHHTEKTMEVRESLFRIPKIVTALNFFGIQHNGFTTHKRFDDLLLQTIDNVAVKIQNLYKRTNRKESAIKELLVQADNECSDEMLIQARKQWLYYSAKLMQIVKDNSSYLIEFLIGSTLRKGNQERAIDNLKNKYKLTQLDERTRRLIALARYKVVYTENVEEETIPLSPSFAFILCQELFLDKKETFALHSKNARINLN